MGRLKKELSSLEVFGVAIGAIIGWGCFVLPGNSFLPKAGPGGTALGMFIGALMVIIISNSYGFMVKNMPLSGGEFEYTRAYFGDTHAFWCGWFLTLAYLSLVPMNGTAMALISRYLVPGIIQIGKLYSIAGWDVFFGEIILVFCTIIGIGIINIYGIKMAGILQKFVSVLLVLSILIVTIAVLFSGVDSANLYPLFQTDDGQAWYEGVFSIIAVAPFAYVGFDCVPQVAEEYRFPHKRAKVIMMFAILVASILYISVNTVTAIVKPWKAFLAEKPFWATGTAIELAIGKMGLILIGIAMLCAVIGGINAFYISASRLMQSMAQKKFLPDIFSKLDEKHGTPKMAILFVMVVSLIAPWFGREVLGSIVDMCSVGTAIAFFYTTSSAVKVARANHDRKVEILGILGVIFSIGFLFLLLLPFSPAFLSTPSLACLLIWIILGVIFKVYCEKRRIQNHEQ